MAGKKLPTEKRLKPLIRNQTTWELNETAELAQNIMSAPCTPSHGLPGYVSCGACTSSDEDHTHHLLSIMAEGAPVDATDLSPAQLNDVRQQIEEELKLLTTSYGRLVEAQGKFRSCIASCEYLQSQAQAAAKAGNGQTPTSLIPLTSSLYVPGQIKSPDRVLVDIGTGYFVDKSVSDAIKLYQDKIKFLNDQIRSLQETIQKKQDNLRVATDILRVVCFLRQRNMT